MKYLQSIPVLFAIGALAGCVNGFKATRAELVGHYVATLPNESVNIDLASDGSFLMKVRRAFGPDMKSGPFVEGTEEGVWRFEDGYLLLQSKDGTHEQDYFSSFAHILIPKDRSGRVFVNPEDPKFFILRKSGKENHALAAPASGAPYP